jgi:hypothetical protein
MKESMNNVEIVTLAVYLIGGDSKYVDTEDIAVKVNKVAPGRFVWLKYPDQINIENVRKRLSDAMKKEQGGYIVGSTKKGWMLTKAGAKFCRGLVKSLKGVDLSRAPLNSKEIAWRRHEKTRMLGTAAFEKVSANEADTVTHQEAEAFFRIDDYVTGEARNTKLIRFTNTFGDDPDLGKTIKILVKKVRKE